ncbi:MAG: helix-turn-helix domain-containing protein [Thermoplasmata archaeon]
MNPLLEVRLDGQARNHPLSDLLQGEGALAHLVACRLSDRAPRQLMRWLDIEVDPVRMEPLLRSLRRRFRARHLAVARLGPGRVLVRVSEPAPPICAATYEAGGICVTCPLLLRTERESWRVILPRGSQTNAFVRELPGDGGARRAIARVAPYRSRTSLTYRQDLALRVAFDLGYFGYPRRGTLADVARALGTSRSTTLEILRRATAKLAGRRYGDELRGRVGPEVHRRPPRTGH